VIFKTVSHIGRRSRSDGVKFRIVRDLQDGISHRAAKPERWSQVQDSS
jgi:hypothetical protein